MRKVLYVFSTILLAWLFQHISLTGDEPRKLPYELFLNGDDALLAPGGREKVTVQTFLSRTSETNYLAQTVNMKGETIRRLQIPTAEITKESGEKISLAGKPGFITAPNDGSYFLWYPRLGSQIYFFDHEGRFIWDKPESRYLLASERGKYLLAAAGDHSRMMLLNPDMKTLLDFEGLLFISWQISDNEKNVLQLCLASLDGELVAGKADGAFFARKRIAQNIKSAYCNLQSGEFGVIAEKSFVDKKDQTVITHEDYLITGNVKTEKSGDGYKAEIQITEEIGLQLTSQRKLPLILSDSFSVILAERNGKAVALLRKNNSNDFAEIQLHTLLLGEFNADDWRAHHTKDLIFFRNEKQLLVFDKYGLNYVFRGENLLNTRVEQDVLLIQSNRMIAGYVLQ